MGANISAEGTRNQLKYCWSVDPVLPGYWHTETATGTNTAYSAPSIAETSTNANIAVVGPSNSLWFSVSGTPWKGVKVAPAGCVS